MADVGTGSSRALPAAILGAGAFIGLGLFFGLRRDPSSVEEASSAARVPAIALEATSTERVPRPSADPVAPVTVAAVTVDPVGSSTRSKAAAASLEAQRKEIVERCIAPSMAKQPEPKTVRVTFNVSFGVDGKEVGRGIVEDRRNARRDVGACIQQSLKPLSVPASTESFSIDLPWELP